MVQTSIIVRAFNEAKHLPALFDGIDAQSYRDFEVILVDSGSYDRTREISEERGARLVRINSQDFTFGYSLNVGIEAAKGEYIVIVSAHTAPVDDGWLARLIAPLQDEQVVMSYGRQVGVIESKFSEAVDFDRFFGTHARDDTPRNIKANNANSAIRKTEWIEKKFHPLLPGLEDADWASHWLRRDRRVVYVQDATIRHIHEETWPQIRRRFYREAVAARRMGLLGRRHIPREVSRDIRRTFHDLALCFRPSGNPAAQRLNFARRLADVLMYRTSKVAGMIRGLTDRNPLDSRESQDAVFFNRDNRAVVIQAPGRAKLEVRDLPALKPGDVLIRVDHVAVCATDLEIFDGKLGYYNNGMASFPIVPGHEFSGHIAATGSNVDTLAEGDPVVVECIQSCSVCEECRAGNPIGCDERTELGVMRRDGAYAEYLAVPAKFAHRLPPELDLAKAALTEPVAVALKGLGKLQAALSNRAGPWKCAVLGAGPLGHICARVLSHYGHEVTAYDRNSDRLALFRETSIQTSETLRELDTFDIIVEITGDPDVLDAALHGSRANATLLLLGLPYGERGFSFEAIAAYDKTVIGSVGSTAADFEAAIDLLGKLDVDEHLKCRLPLEAFAEGWEKARNGEVLKVILDVADPGPIQPTTPLSNT
jgi:threonine dehydrogenase-like Zn-dependent dehydrogenase/glycosyltransferase involved in cell wall biosynthesis